MLLLKLFVQINWEKHYFTVNGKYSNNLANFVEWLYNLIVPSFDVKELTSGKLISFNRNLEQKQMVADKKRMANETIEYWQRTDPSNWDEA